MTPLRLDPQSPARETVTVGVSSRASKMPMVPVQSEVLTVRGLVIELTLGLEDLWSPDRLRWGGIQQLLRILGRAVR